MPPTPTHLRALDFYRFVAATGVAVLHFTEFANYDAATGIGGNVAMFYMFVDFFFVLSGFVIGLQYFQISSPSEILSFLRKRIARIYPMHFITLAIYLVPALLLISTNTGKYDLP